uniref:RAB6-interacting golgin n=1 Tax=Trichuris muris TaxID=70415 RepID=A0A5S6R246_TRIMR
MFSFLSTNGGQSSGQPSPSLIKEANEHVRMMHLRIQDLEQRIREQSELLDRRDIEQRDQLKRIRIAQEAEKATYYIQYEKLEHRCEQLETLLREKEVQIAYLMHRCSFLDEAASYVPLIDQLAQCLKMSLAAPPPKVHPVRPTKSTSEEAAPMTKTIHGLSTVSEESGHVESQD